MTRLLASSMAPADHFPVQSSNAQRPIRCGQALDESAFAPIRRRLVLEGCKWDPQVGDVATLARFPLIITAATWRELARLAESLCAEALAAEAEVLERPDLWRHLAIPRRIRRALCGRAHRSDSRDRVMRFDFHPTREHGWRIS